MERWSDTQIQTVIALAAVIGVLVFEALPDVLRWRRR